ncbi:MAG: VOC family protein [Vicinamibacterales bacterium]
MALLPDDAHIGAVTLRVRDLDRSSAFYQEVLGFRELHRSGRVASLGTANEHTLIALEEHPGAVFRPRRSAGLFHVAILTPSRAALGRSLRRLVDRGWPLSGVADHLVSEALYLDDPDGLGLEIYRDRPRDSWQRHGPEIIMGTDPLDIEELAREPGAELPWNGLDAGTVIGHVHLQVPHLDTAESFYCQGGGFTPMLRRYPGALFVAAGGYHHHVGLNTWAGVGVPPPPGDAVGLRRFIVQARDLAPREVVDAATGVVVAFTPTGGNA